uniref:FAD-binding FR-type domain-containing protein n=1 Tax=Chromera velia CCMP2878 TaxID=1169474 RepID=A0A0G4FMK9_9ALVE|eukprot:Cvel_17624.t1-p1 / transcript=Cvel_17624.t1 / gene=Cvel_17624 / organism=Chromera_velia_CCMP2878 / gene_product=Oxidoreductase NAD-binding domain-containing, putative / transcript_product=Oxidoreductase NAD-binding domain-containing, putative / location=Cvel_scaffold1418:30005-33643(-) / protein_length=310 / sequence_SO=supercontig / SO=protein_coding / is_pseudo=false
MSARPHFSAVISQVKPRTPTVRELVLSLRELEGYAHPSEFSFLPGQWIDFQTPEMPGKIGGYSFASAPSRALTQKPPCFTIAVKRSDHAMANWIHEKAETGKETSFRVGGSFSFDWRADARRLCEEGQDRRRKLLLVAGGIGITPLMAVLDECYGSWVSPGGEEKENTKDQAPQPTLPPLCCLVYSVNCLEETAFAEELSQMAKHHREHLSVQVVVTGSSSSGQYDALHLKSVVDNARPLVTQSGKGRLGEDHLRAAITQSLGVDLQGKGEAGHDLMCLLCGPGEMMASVETDLLTLGVPKESVKCEKWW